MTKYQILLGISRYLDGEYFVDRCKSEEYIDYISRISTDVWEGEGTADPAYYEDFKRILDEVMGGDKCSVEEGLAYAKYYLAAYNKMEKDAFGPNIDEVAAVFEKCPLDQWRGLIGRNATE